MTRDSAAGRRADTGKPMRCLFCQGSTASSRSVEHVIPESLGNEEHVLPVGTVCDDCNNYFGQKIEADILTSTRFHLDRAWLAVPNKRGRFPSIPSFPILGGEMELCREPRSGRPYLAIDADQSRNRELLKQVRRQTVTSACFPTGGPGPDSRVFSRFLAKVAIEALALRLLTTTGSAENYFREDALSALRTHARRGTPRIWDYHSRRIYDADEVIEGSEILHEFMFFVLSPEEWYFVLCIFGIEYSMNMLDPNIDGYRRWLNDNNQASPLYLD